MFVNNALMDMINQPMDLLVLLKQQHLAIINARVRLVIQPHQMYAQPATREEDLMLETVKLAMSITAPIVMLMLQSVLNVSLIMVYTNNIQQQLKNVEDVLAIVLHALSVALHSNVLHATLDTS